MDLGRRYAEADYHTRPRHQCVQSKAVEGLARNGIVSKAGLTPEALASVRASELTARDSETVNQFQERGRI